MFLTNKSIMTLQISSLEELDAIRQSSHYVVATLHAMQQAYLNVNKLNQMLHTSQLPPEKVYLWTSSQEVEGENNR